MQNADLTESDKFEIGKAWDLSEYSREIIEGQLMNSKIVAVYPVIGIDCSKPETVFYSAGLAIVYQQPGKPGLRTLEISTQTDRSREDETSIEVIEGFLAPEPLFLLEGIK